MIYTNIDSVMQLIADSDIDGMTRQNREYIRAMLAAYWGAYHNPPAGVIGVGCITYAEQALIEYQLDNATEGN